MLVPLIWSGIFWPYWYSRPFAQSESMRPIISKWFSNINLIYNLNSKFMEAFRMLYDSYISKKSKKKSIKSVTDRQEETLKLNPVVRN